MKKDDRLSKHGIYFHDLFYTKAIRVIVYCFQPIWNFSGSYTRPEMRYCNGIPVVREVIRNIATTTAKGRDL